jgi:diamine N-acetyltransferase
MNDILNDGVYRLRAPEPEDLEVLYTMENDTTLWFVSYNVAPYSRYQLKKYISESVHDIYSDHQIRFMIERISDGLVLGCIDLTELDSIHCRAQVGVVVLSEYRKNGVAMSALQILCRYVDSFLHLHQLYGFVPMDNADSLNLFINSGFEETSVLKEWLMRGKTYVDVCVVQKFF